MIFIFNFMVSDTCKENLKFYKMSANKNIDDTNMKYCTTVLYGYFFNFFFFYVTEKTR